MKINEVSKYDLVALEFMSGSDQDRAHDLADKDGIEILQSGTGSRPSIFNVERDSLHGAVFVSHLRHNGIEFEDKSGEGLVPPMMQGKSQMVKDFADEQGYDVEELPFTTDLNENIAVGKKYHIMVYDVMSNMRVPRQVEIIDYVKAPGQKDSVVYKDGKGKVRKMPVGAFKKRLESYQDKMGQLEESSQGVYKVFVNTTGDPPDSWATNAMEYHSVEEAEEAARDLFMRWTAVKSWRVMDPHTQEVYAEGP